MRTILLMLAALLVAAPQTQPQFRSGTDIVPIDFLALDDKGRPVADLRASELALRVDGQVREIRSVQFYKLSATSAEAPVPLPALPPAFGTNETTTPNRPVIIVVDHTQIRAGEGRSELDAAGRFLDRLAPLDRVGVVTLPDGKVESDLTTNHARVRKTLDNVIGHAVRPDGKISTISLDEALTVQKELLDPDKKFTKELVDRECNFASADGFCRTRVVQDALDMARATQRATHASLIAFKDFLNGINAAEGPTTIVYMSSGLVEFEETRLDLEDVGKAAARARVQLFVIQPHEALLDATARNQPPTMTIDNMHRLTGLEHLAGVTGGELFRVTGLGDNAFTRVADQISAYYLLGFEPKRGEQDGKSHSLRITTTRRGVTIRSRPTFFLDDPNRTAPPPPVVLDTMLRDLASHRGLPLRATAFAFRDKDPRYLKIAVAVEPAETSVTLTAASFALVDATGKNAAQWREEGANVVLRPLLSGAAVPPGDYRLRVAAQDTSGRRGTVDYEFTAILSEAPPLKVGSLMTGQFDAGNFRPRLLLEPRDASVAGYVELYGLVPPGSMVAATFEIASSPNGPPLESAVGTVLASADADRQVATADVPLAKVPAGDYVLRCVVTVNGQRIGAVSRTIRRP
jgi:VWFA-related protein